MSIEDIHNRINELSKERGISPYELARRSGIAQSSLYNMFERGTMPKIETLERICKGLEIDMSDFFICWSKPRSGGYISQADEDLLEMNHNLTERNQKNNRIC